MRNRRKKKQSDKVFAALSLYWRRLWIEDKSFSLGGLFTHCELGVRNGLGLACHAFLCQGHSACLSLRYPGLGVLKV